MKKISLLFIALFVSISSHAEWTNVLPGNNASLYIDFKTLEEKAVLSIGGIWIHGVLEVRRHMRKVIAI